MFLDIYATCFTTQCYTFNTFIGAIAKPPDSLRFVVYFKVDFPALKVTGLFGGFLRSKTYKFFQDKTFSY